MRSWAVGKDSASLEISERTSSSRVATGFINLNLARRVFRSGCRNTGNLPDSFGAWESFRVNGPREGSEALQQRGRRSIQKLVANVEHTARERGRGSIP